MKKIFKSLITLILCVITCITPVMVANAETAPDTFKASYHWPTTPIKFPGEYTEIKTTTGKYVHCLHYIILAPNTSITYTRKSEITDNGMNYILKKSYGAKNDSEDFVYKTALWLYMVDKGIMPGDISVLKAFNSQIKNDNSAVATQIKTLVADAKKAGANDTSAPTISVNTGANTFKLDSTGKYYVSNTVTVNSSTGSYTVSLTNAPEGSTVEKTGNTFVVKVPADKVTKLATSISFKVSNTKDIYQAYRYEPNNSAYQPLAYTIKNTKTASATGQLSIKRTVSVPILKVDAANGKGISGAELQLTNSKGEVIKTWTSTEKAELINLGEGTYTVTETKAPEGYNTLKTTVKFSVDSKGNLLNAEGNNTVQILIINERKTGGVSISKQDITNKEELPGATLVIKDYDGNVIEEWVSTNEPHYIEKLEPGIYTLTETIAPEGYVLSTETITFTVKDDGSITEVVMYNTPNSKEEIPVENTASFKTITSSLIGSIIIIAGSYIIFKNSKKKEVM